MHITNKLLRYTWVNFVLLSVFTTGSVGAKTDDTVYDLVVYGDSSGAVTATVAAKRQGHSVILINPTGFLGGMSASGLGATDFLGQRATFGGIASEFYKAVAKAYGKDSHGVQHIVHEQGHVRNEGVLWRRPPKPYPISYRSIIPRKGECENLFAPVCRSASHVAHGSIRMEPVFMVLSQSAATAAGIAIADDIAVQDVDYTKLKAQLLKENQKL